MTVALNVPAQKAIDHHIFSVSVADELLENIYKIEDFDTTHISRNFEGVHENAIAVLETYTRYVFTKKKPISLFLEYVDENSATNLSSIVVSNDEKFFDQFPVYYLKNLEEYENDTLPE